MSRSGPQAEASSHRRTDPTRVADGNSRSCLALRRGREREGYTFCYWDRLDLGCNRLGREPHFYSDPASRWRSLDLEPARSAQSEGFRNHGSRAG